VSSGRCGDIDLENNDGRHDCKILAGKLNIDQQTINILNVSDSIEDNVVPSQWTVDQ